MTAPLIATSAAGAAIAYGLQNEDNPPDQSAFVVWIGHRGPASAPQPLAGAQAPLALTFDDRALQLVTGTSPPGLGCCSTAALATVTKAGGLGRPAASVGGLAGTTAARLVALGRRLLLAVATERGVWAAQSSSAGHFGPVRRLASAYASPQTLAAAPLAGGAGGVVAWTAGLTTAGGAQRIEVATSTGARAPRAARTAVRERGGHGIDELDLAPGRQGATLAWSESWYDRRGFLHTRVLAADAGSLGDPSAFVVRGGLASGLSLASDSHGDQVLAWKVCSPAGTCSVRAAIRRAGHGFGGSSRVGTIDATDDPVAAVGGGGQGLLGWIDRGNVVACALGSRATRFTRTHLVSGTSDAADLTIAFAPGGRALAVWVQGTLEQSVAGATYIP